MILNLYFIGESIADRILSSSSILSIESYIKWAHEKEMWELEVFFTLIIHPLVSDRAWNFNAFNNLIVY